MQSEVQVMGESKADAGDAPRIVVGFDGSDESLSALEWAARQAELTGSALEIVAAWEWPTSLGWAPMPGYDPVAETKKLLEPTLKSLRDARPKVAVGWKVVEGHPAPSVSRTGQNSLSWVAEDTESSSACSLDRQASTAWPMRRVPWWSFEARTDHSLLRLTSGVSIRAVTDC